MLSGFEIYRSRIGLNCCLLLFALSTGGCFQISKGLVEKDFNLNEHPEVTKADTVLLGSLREFMPEESDARLSAAFLASHPPRADGAEYPQSYTDWKNGLADLGGGYGFSFDTWSTDPNYSVAEAVEANLDAGLLRSLSHDNQLQPTLTSRLAAAGAELRVGDYRAYADSLKNLRYVSLAPVDGASLDADKARFQFILRAYFAAALSEKGFIDRNGSALMLKQSGTKVTTDFLSVASRLFVEALADSKMTMPVFYVKEEASGSPVAKYVTTSGLIDKVPTFAKLVLSEKTAKFRANNTRLLRADLVVEVSAGNNSTDVADITLGEAKLIAHLGEVARSYGEVGGGMLVDAIGDVDIGILVSTEIAIGDSDTFSELVKSVISTTASRSSLAYFNAEFRKYNVFESGEAYKLLFRAINFANDNVPSPLASTPPR